MVDCRVNFTFAFYGDASIIRDSEMCLLTAYRLRATYETCRDCGSEAAEELLRVYTTLRHRRK